MSTAEDTHLCLLCDRERIPHYRALCKYCFPHVPWRLRADLLRGWWFRTYDRPACDEAIIALRQWVNQYTMENPQ